MSRVHDVATIIGHHSIGEGGLVHSLRPYQGAIDRRALAAVLAAVRTLKKEAKRGEPMPIALVAGIFRLTNTVRRWALDGDSMLVRNKRIEPPQWEQLMDWVIKVESEYSELLGVLEERERAAREPDRATRLRDPHDAK